MMYNNINLINKLRFYNGTSYKKFNTVGVVGVGNIGQILISRFLQYRLNINNPLYILANSKGSPDNLKKISNLGLDLKKEFTYDTQHVLDESRLVFVATRPQDVNHLSKFKFNNESLYVFMTPLLTIEKLHKLTHISHNNLISCYVCGHNIININGGVATVYPHNNPHYHFIRHLFEIFGFRMLNPLKSDKECLAYWPLIVLPAAIFACMENSIYYSIHDVRNFAKSINLDMDIKNIDEIYHWSVEQSYNLIGESSETLYREYINKMFTKGGITEIMVTSINNGCNLEEALHIGYSHFENLSQNI